MEFIHDANLKNTTGGNIVGATFESWKDGNGNWVTIYERGDGSIGSHVSSQY